MECKTTSRAKRAPAGYTLTEYVVSMGLTVLALGSLMAMWVFSNQSTLTIASYVDLDGNARAALERLASDIRQSTNITRFATNSIDLMHCTDGKVTYSWDPNKQTLQCSRPGSTTTLLQDCVSLSFAMYKAAPVDGVMDLETTTRIKECKGVKVAWKCVRHLYGIRTATENITSATFVLRMQD